MSLTEEEVEALEQYYEVKIEVLEVRVAELKATFSEALRMIEARNENYDPNLDLAIERWHDTLNK